MTNAERQARYRKRLQAAAQAEYAGAVVLDVAVVARARDGHIVVTLYDGPALHLYERTTVVPPTPAGDSPNQPPGTAPVAAPKLYPPKSIPPEKYAEWKGRIHEVKPTHEALLKSLSDSVTEFAASDPLRSKQNRQLAKMLQAIPDGPDWIDLLP